MIGDLRSIRLGRCSQLLLAALCLWFTISAVIAQEGERQPTEFPFRRVFVPQNDLKAIGVDDLIPIDVKLLDDLLRKYAAASQADLTKQSASDSNESVQLRSAYYVAKLIGADLVSERSHLTFVGGNRDGDRMELAPWSLAIQPTNGLKLDSQSPPPWTFNERGEPRLAVTPNRVDQPSAMHNQSESTFGWSTKADASSTPNKLKFAMEVPNCANSCLILALPPQAEVQDSLTVVQRVSDWSQIDRRLTDWSNFTKEYGREASTGLASESVWLVELGGSQTASFSISLGSDSRSQNAQTNAEGRRYEQLVRTQNLQHFIDGNEIRTVCDAEILVSPEQPRFRLSLQPGSKLRRLTVNQLDVDWKVEQGWIVGATGLVGQESNSATYVSVMAEFFSSFASDQLGKIDTVTPSFDHSYVMSGSTVVQNASPWRLTQVNCEASRIVQPIEDTRASSVNRIEYSWSAQPPKLSLGLERTVSTRRCETLIRLSNDEIGTSAVIRAKLLFSEQDSSHTELEIMKGWRLQSLTSIDPNDSVSFREEKETISGREFQLTWDRVQKSRVAEIELRLFCTAEESVGQPRQIDCQSIFRFPGWQLSETIVLDPDEVFHLEARDSLLDRMITEDLVSDWQKTLLPKSIKGNLFRFDTQSTTQPLVWEKKWVRPRVSSKTDIELSGISTIRARHELQVNMMSNRSEALAIVAPSKDVVWRRKEGELWVPFAPLPSSPVLTKDGQGLWLFDIRTLGLQPKLLAVVNCEFQEDREVLFPVPKIQDFEMVSQVAQSLSSEVILDCIHPSAEWTINDLGAKVLVLPANKDDTNVMVSAKVLRKGSSKKWFFDASELHVAVDTMGSQKASLTLHANAVFPGPLAIELENGWEPLAVRIQTSASIQEIPIQLDGQRLVIPRQPVGRTGGVGYEIDFIGPQLTPSKALLALGQSLSFQWPVFSVDAECVRDQKHLWLPAELQLDGFDLKGSDSADWVEYRNWPLWGWSRRVFATVFGNNSIRETNSPLPHFPALHRLVPNWESTGWRLVREIQNRVESDVSGLENNRTMPLSIGRVFPDRTLLSLFFIAIALVTPCLMKLRFHVATWVCICFIVSAHFAPHFVARFAFTGLIGMFLGFLGAILYELMQRRSNSEASQSQRNSAKWSPWNDRQSENESGSNHLGMGVVGALRSNAVKMSSLGLLFLSCGALANHSALFGSMAVEWSVAPDDKVTAFQILLPIDEAGELVGTTAYVQQEMLDGLTGKNEGARWFDRGTFPVSAKYSLRAGMRGRFNSSDQLTMTYEFMVGEELAPVRIPVNASQLLLPRFTVDGIDLSLGNRLRSNGTFWTWIPDRPGKKTVQIIAQPVLKQNELDRNKEFSAQLLDVAILPLANASIDIQTDPKNSVDVLSRGRVTDPESGRFVAMLGAVDRLNCSIRTPITKSSSSAASSAENGEVPTMHTELFLQNDILQAKTIVDFPRSHAFGAQVEIEADLQWLPVGSQWGDAQLVETRSGSNLFRRRYVLEWKIPVNSVAGSPLASRDRQISVIWVPQTTTQSLNVLFAECLERGTRRGTLRVARSFPSWSIEGISTWIPAIGSKDRLDWPELKTNLLALSLRIPPNGGFGILKPKAIVDKPQQARVTTKWSIEQNRESVASMIAWFGNSQTSEPLVLELPDGYQVAEVYNRNGPIRFLQSKASGKLKLQVLADRKFLELSDLWIQAKRQVESSENANESQWRSPPWIDLPSNIASDQTLEIQATERIALNLDSDQTVYYGKGLSVPLYVLQKSTSENQANGTVASRFKIICREVPLTGTLQLKLDSTANPKELELKAELASSITSRPFFVLEVPYFLKDRWQSEARIVPIPCPDEKNAWLQVHLPEPVPNVGLSPITAIVRFSLRPDDSAAGLDNLTRIHALDTDRIPTHLIDSATGHDRRNDVLSEDKPQSDSIGNAHPDIGPSIAMSIFQVRDENFMSTQTKRFVLLESQFWLTETHSAKDNELVWEMDDSVEVLSVEMDNKPIPFRHEGDRIRCAWIPSGLCSDVRLFSKHEVRSIDFEKVLIEAPQLKGRIQRSVPLLLRDGNVTVSMRGLSIPSTDLSDAISHLTHTCLDVLEKSKTSWPKLVSIEAGSDFDDWRKHWSQKSFGYLEDWARTVGTIEEQSFGDAVTKWHSLKPLMGTPKKIGKSEKERWELNSELNPQTGESQPNLWYSFFGCVIIVGAVTWFTPLIGTFLLHRPWWCHVILGLLTWLVTGSLLPTLVMGTIGLIVAIDCYWMITSRLRRSEIRGLR
ncbi:MAG: hypothetical protein NTY15_16960 [Planctomycetota bacterium]|nr:hypothetical protein [Planctomycetota bacterium]